MARFIGEQSPRHPGTLLWPGIYGFPVLAPAPSMLKWNEQLRRAVPIRFFYAKTFDLSNQEDMDYYLWVMDRVANGWFTINYQDRKWTDTGQKIYLEWYQSYFKIMDSDPIVL